MILITSIANHMEQLVFGNFRLSGLKSDLDVFAIWFDEVNRSRSKFQERKSTTF